MKKAIVKVITCLDCGVEITWRSNARYCPPCRQERKKLAQRVSCVKQAAIRIAERETPKVVVPKYKSPVSDKEQHKINRSLDHIFGLGILPGQSLKNHPDFNSIAAQYRPPTYQRGVEA